MTVSPGLEVCLEQPPEQLATARSFALLTHQAAVDHRLQNSADLLHARFPDQLRCLMSPQHGLWATEQDNMVETAHGRHPQLGLPVHSLYSETRRPTPEMLDGVDLLVVDLQDVGCRVYTFIWTVSHCLEVCAERNIPVLVLDRPNPLGGTLAEGPALDLDYESFVGRAAIPMRHGLTLGELAGLVNQERGIDCELQVVRMRGYDRSTLWPEVGREWLPPSPNLPRFGGVQVYPGQVLLEGTNLSEGRGTTTPFEQWGAPFLDPWRLLAALPQERLPGCALRPISFVPTFQKHVGQNCQGLFVHPTDAAAFSPYRTTLALLRAVWELWPEHARWLSPPYEYEATHMPIDILTGGPEVRQWIEQRGSWDELETLAAAPMDWWQRVADHLLY